MALSVVGVNAANGFHAPGAGFTLAHVTPAANDLVLGGAGMNGTPATHDIELPVELTDIALLAEDWTAGQDGMARVGDLNLALGTEDANYTFRNAVGSAGNEELAGGCITIRGADTTDPYRVTPAARHKVFVNDNAVVTPPSIGGTANGEPALLPGDMVVCMHFMLGNAFDETGSPAPPTGMVMPAGGEVTGNRRNFFIAYKVLEAGDLSSGTFTPTAWQHVYDTGEGAENSYTVILAIAQGAPNITAVDDVTLDDGQTAVGITLTGGGADQGTGKVVISPNSDPEDAGAVDQTPTAWADDAISFTAVLGGLGADPTLTLFVRNDAGEWSNGFDIDFNAPSGKTEVTVEVVNITAVVSDGADTVITAPGHGIATAQEFFAYDCQGAVELNSPAPVNGTTTFYQGTAEDADTIRIVGLDSSGWGAYTGGGKLSTGIPIFYGQTPTIEDGDIVVHDTLTTPGGHTLTISPDGVPSHDGLLDTAQQTYVFNIYDLSADAMLGQATGVLNNDPPDLIEDPIPEQNWVKGIAVALDFSVYIDDPNMDATTAMLTRKRPWMSDLVDEVTTGTPDEGDVSDFITVQYTDVWGYVSSWDVAINIDDSATVPDVDDGDVAITTAIAQIEALGFNDVQPVPQVSGAVARENVISQVPAAGTIHPLDDPIVLTYSSEEGVVVTVDGSGDFALVASKGAAGAVVVDGSGEPALTGRKQARSGITIDASGDLPIGGRKQAAAAENVGATAEITFVGDAIGANPSGIARIEASAAFETVGFKRTGGAESVTASLDVAIVPTPARGGSVVFDGSGDASIAGIGGRLAEERVSGTSDLVVAGQKGGIGQLEVDAVADFVLTGLGPRPIFDTENIVCAARFSHPITAQRDVSE